MNEKDYSIIVAVDNATLQALKESNYYLYSFKAVQSTDRASMPLVWSRTENYDEYTKVDWSDEYQAYLAFKTNVVGVNVSTPISLGQIWTINQSDGQGEITEFKDPQVIAILNATHTQFTCGIAESQKPICALLLYGGNLQLFIPLPKILLMFSTISVDQGSAMETSYGPGVLIDLGSGINHCSVSFDINNGWSWDKSTQAQSIPANSNLTPLLIEYSEKLALLSTNALESPFEPE